MSTEVRHSPEVEGVLRASDAILEHVEIDPNKSFDPVELVERFSPKYGQYSSRAAILNLIELKKLKLDSNWFLTLNRSSSV